MKQDKNIERVDKGWQAMSSLLDDKMPQKRKRRRFIFFWLFLATCLIGSKVVFDNYIKKDNTLIQNESTLANYNNSNIRNGDSDNIDNNISNFSSKSITDGDSKTIGVSNTLINTQQNQNTTEEQPIISMRNSEEIKSKVSTSTKSYKFTNNQKEQSFIKTQNQKQIILPVQKNENTKSFVEEGKYIQSKTNKVSSALENYSQLVIGNQEKNIALYSKLNHLDFIPLIPNSNKLDINGYTLEIDLSKYKAIEPLKQQSSNSIAFNFGIKTGGTYLVNAKTFGFSPSAFLEIERNNKWGIGLEVLTTFANRNNNTLDLLRNDAFNNITENEVNDTQEDIPTGLQLGSSEATLLEDSDRSEILNAFTTNLNSIGINLYSFLNINSKVKLSFGIGLDQYVGNKSLNNVYVLGLDTNQNDPLLSTYIFAQKKIIFNTNVSVNYQLLQNFDVFASYDYALTNLVEEAEFTLNTNRIKLGLSYNF